jgi:hypothetical protein
VARRLAVVVHEQVLISAISAISAISVISVISAISTVAACCEH